MPIINPRLFYAFALLALITAPTCPNLECGASAAQSFSAENDAPAARKPISVSTHDPAPDVNRPTSSTRKNRPVA